MAYSYKRHRSRRSRTMSYRPNSRTRIISYKRNSKGKTIRKRYYYRPLTEEEIRLQNITGIILGALGVFTIGGIMYGTFIR